MKQSIQNGIVWLLGIALMSPLFGWSQGLITGTVSDENGMPLPGATVVVEETNADTTTDFDGNYQISASTGQTLIFSYVGYESQSVAVGTSLSIDVQLQAANELEEVVLTGVAGKTDLKKVYFAVGKVNEDEIQQAPGVNPANAIRSKVPGVTVVQGSGLPGNASAIRIREATSLIGSHAPLIILDGVILEGTLADINSEYIESMEILKGSAASSLYGSRAANGVIQIFTKRGSSNLGTYIKIRSEYGVS